MKEGDQGRRGREGEGREVKGGEGKGNLWGRQGKLRGGRES